MTGLGRELRHFWAFGVSLGYLGCPWRGWEDSRQVPGHPLGCPWDSIPRPFAFPGNREEERGCSGGCCTGDAEPGCAAAAIPEVTTGGRVRPVCCSQAGTDTGSVLSCSVPVPCQAPALSPPVPGAIVSVKTPAWVSTHQLTVHPEQPHTHAVAQSHPPCPSPCTIPVLVPPFSPQEWGQSNWAAFVLP